MKFKYKKKFIIQILLILIFLISVLSILLDIKKNSDIVIIPREKPSSVGNIDLLLYKLMNGETYDSELIDSICEYINSRYDCSDFIMPSLMRVLYEYSDKLYPDDLKKLVNSVLNFKYWMTDPGLDSMCYWSENHQILFSTAEYLAGNLYPDKIFSNTGMTGREHATRGRERILTWLEQKWNYGFIEWYSNTYYKEDLGPLAVLADFASDKEIEIKSKIILDLLFYDLSSQSFNGVFVTTTGRGYETKKMSGLTSSMKSEMEHFFNFDVDPSDRESINMGLNIRYSNSYIMPSVFYEIAHDKKASIIKASTGLNVDELKDLNLIGQDDNQVMMQWGMESFSNPQIISNSIQYIEEKNMFSNSDFYSFKDLNFSLLKNLNLLPLISSIIDLQTNGISIQRANTYTYRTPNYSMYTTQNYHPGDYGDQHHISGLTLSNQLSIFHSHPAVDSGEDGVNGNSPSYWVGYGHLPHSVQYNNVNLSIYNLPTKKGLMEKKLLDYTHAYFPSKYFDESSIEGGLAFARLGNTYVAFITPGELFYKEHEIEHNVGGFNYDLILKGKDVYWITEASDNSIDINYKAFKNRIKKQANEIHFDGSRLVYNTTDTNLDLEFNGNFKVNEKVVDLEYIRFDSPYIQSDRTPNELTFKYNGKELYLNFHELIRTFN